MLMEKVFASAKPVLANKTVADLVIGVSLIGVQLSDGSVGVSYVLRDSLPNGCSAFPYIQEVCGKSALEIAEWTVNGTDNLQRAVAAAVLSAASNDLGLPNDTSSEVPFNLEIKPGDTIGMVGFIKPVAKLLAQQAKMIIFDEGISLHGGDIMLSAMEDQPRLLPTCDIVILSGTTTINGSIDSLLEMCKNAREIVLVGPSTPMYPEGWAGTGVTALAGSLWNNSHKDEIFRMISLACGVSHLNDYVVKKNARV